jgi:3-oxoacyl-[acyl-carrier-protein] synthase-3
VVNGIVDVANRIELGQIRAGLVVACESSRRINEFEIAALLADPTMERFRASLTTLTGGSGAAAVLVTDGSFGEGDRRMVLGGVQRAAPEHFALCRWGVRRSGPTTVEEYAQTDSIGILEHGGEIMRQTWSALLEEMGWQVADVDRMIAHQIGRAHRETMLRLFEMREDQDYATYPFLGNMGTVALPMTAALAEERGFLEPGQNVGLLGVGSGLNSLMLGVRW